MSDLDARLRARIAPVLAEATWPMPTKNALRAVLDLHKPIPGDHSRREWSDSPHGRAILHQADEPESILCEHCVEECYHQPYPCATVRAIAKQLRVTYD